MHCCDYKTFLNDSFWEYLLSNLSLEKVSSNYSGYEKVLQVSIDALDDLTSHKKKYTRGNKIPFMNKFSNCDHLQRTQSKAHSQVWHNFWQLKALKIFNFLSWLFGHAERWLDKKGKVDFKIYDVTTWETRQWNLFS